MPEREDLAGRYDAEFDVLLRSALNSYADPGPDTELAERVLTRLKAERGRRRVPGWLPWAIGIPVAAGLLILIMLFGLNPFDRTAGRSDQARVSHTQSTPISGNEQPSNWNSAGDHGAVVERVKAHSHRARPLAKVAPLPKLAVFPTPQPLTPAERALADYAAHAPQTDREALIEAQKRMEEPLSIAVIEIQPLEPPDEGGN